MFLPDLPVSLMFGGLIAASNFQPSSVTEEERLAWRKRSLRQTIAFGLLFHCPDSFFAFRWYPDWNLGYLVPWSKVGYSGALLLEAVLFFVLLGGCLWATSAAKWSRVLAPVGAGILGFGGVMAVIWDQYNHIGDYASYHAGTAARSTEDPTFVMFTTLAGAYLIVPLLTLLGHNVLRGRGLAREAVPPQPADSLISS